MATNPMIISRRQTIGTPYPHLGVWGRLFARLSDELGAWLYVAVVLVLVSVLAFAYLAQASYVARQIEWMATLEQQLDVVHERNSMLLLSIAEAEDMPRIKAEARAMGLGEATRIEYLVVILDDLQPAAPGDTPLTPRGGTDLTRGRSSVTRAAANVAAPSSSRLVSTIAQQFQSWIDTPGAGSSQTGSR
jgi:hypothetical protein